jgi:hypothetical protein
MPIGDPSNRAFSERVLGLVSGCCPMCHRVIEVLSLAAPRRVHAVVIAGVLGIGDRNRLRMVLGKHGIRSLGQLNDWIRVLWWLEARERFGWSLDRQSYERGFDASNARVAIRRVTKLRWTEVAALGSGYWRNRFREVVRELHCLDDAL